MSLIDSDEVIKELNRPISVQLIKKLDVPELFSQWQYQAFTDFIQTFTCLLFISITLTFLPFPKEDTVQNRNFRYPTAFSTFRTFVVQNEFEWNIRKPFSF